MPEIILKNGVVTQDVRLDRVQQFDPRSVENFHVRPTLTGAKPRSYTWKVPVGLDQGNEGACEGFGWAHYLASSPRQNQWVADHDAFYIYHESQRIDPWPGGSYPGASPQYEGTSVLAGAQLLNKLGVFPEYRWVTSIDDLILSVGVKGPVVMGIDWYDTMYTPDPHTGVISPAGGKKVGGHCILNHGIDLVKEEFKWWNSWSWHECRISIADVEKLLLDGGEGCVPINKIRAVPEWPKSYS